MEKQDIIAELRKLQGDQSLRSFSASIGISSAYLCDIYKEKRGIGPKVLDYLGIQRKVVQQTTYQRR